MQLYAAINTRFHFPRIQSKLKLLKRRHAHSTWIVIVYETGKSPFNYGEYTANAVNLLKDFLENGYCRGLIIVCVVGCWNQPSPTFANKRKVKLKVDALLTFNIDAFLGDEWKYKRGSALLNLISCCCRFFSEASSCALKNSAALSRLFCFYAQELRDSMQTRGSELSETLEYLNGLTFNVQNNVLASAF